MQHRFDPSTQICIGCDVAATEVFSRILGKSKKSPTICDANYFEIADVQGEPLGVVVAPDRCIITKFGAALIELDSEGLQALVENLDYGR